jgi:glucosylglycerate synthase
VYSFAQGYHRRVMNRDHLLRALTPLYLGWVGSFVIQMKDAGPEKVESRLEKLCNEYEARKPDLIAGW